MPEYKQSAPKTAKTVSQQCHWQYEQMPNNNGKQGQKKGRNSMISVV